MKSIEVVAAVIVKDGRILATQRGYGDFAGGWEFPGGKIEAGETRTDALAREIHEELDAEIEIGPHLITVDYGYPDFHLTMHCYICRLAGEMTLKEHRAARWVGISDIDALDWLPADIEIVEAIKAGGWLS